MNFNNKMPTPDSFVVWKRHVDRLLLAEYAIGTEDAGVGDEQLRNHWKDGEPASEFVEWFATKYDLISKFELGWNIP